MRLWLREEIDRARELLAALMEALLELARRVSGRRDSRLHAHAPRAGGAVAALSAGLFRNVRARLGALQRSARRASTCCRSAAGALAGSGFPFDREAIARDLGFAAITRNSMDVSADRDFALDFLYAAIDHHAAPEPAGRRLDSLFERRVRLAGTGRRRHQRVEPDAAEEESRFARADPRQVRPRVRAASARCMSP